MATTGASAALSVVLAGKNDWSPILEIDLAIDAAGNLLLIDAAGNILMVLAGNNNWTGQTAAMGV